MVWKRTGSHHVDGAFGLVQLRREMQCDGRITNQCHASDHPIEHGLPLRSLARLHHTASSTCTSTININPDGRHFQVMRVTNSDDLGVTLVRTSSRCPCHY